MKLKKILSLILSGAVTAAMAAAFPAYANDYIVIDGREYKPVYTIDDLSNIRNDYNSNFILMNDIDLSATAPGGDWDCGYGWDPIEHFNGYFNGNGHKIKNMHIYGNLSKSGEKYIGLFGKAKNVCNLGLVDYNIDISNSEYNGSGLYIGGLAGIGNSINSVYTTGTLSVDDTSVRNNKGNKTRIWVGGISGHQNSSMKNCFSNCEINITDKDANCCVGGIAGMLAYENKCSISKCYTLGQVNIFDDNAKSGNLIGELYHRGTMESSYYLTNTSGLTACGNKKDSDLNQVKSMTKAQAKSQGVYNFDFEKDWFIDSNCKAFPYPQLVEAPYIGLTKMTLSKKPTKLTYERGSKIDLSGAEVTLKYADGSSVKIKPTSDMAETFNTTSLGKKNVVLKYRDKTVTYEINVVEKKNPVGSGKKDPVFTDKKTGLKITLGDVNKDECVDSSDASNVLVAYSLESTGQGSPLDATQNKVADVNGDGSVNASDASLILAHYSLSQTGQTVTFASLLN